jgi:arylsulfatase A-like enzyme/Flp pilus assembly protein TadD
MSIANLPRLPKRRACGRQSSALVGGLAACLLVSCGVRGDHSIELPTGTPVILISIDTLRADHLPAYGYRGVETPAIDALAKDSVLYTHAYSHTPLTLPSHTSLLTGLLPAETGVRDNVGYSLDPSRISSHAIPYLPLMLHEHGYATGAAVSAFVLQRKTGLATGFDLYDDAIEFRSGTGLGGLQRPGEETLKSALSWVRSVGNRPFFLFFHLYEPHTPYEPPEPFASRYASKYDGEIATADAIVGHLLDELRAEGIYERALVILLSDHGEGLGDHGEAEHGVLLYNEAIHVPLLVKLPKAELGGRRTDAPAQLLDVAPTVASLLGLPPSPRWRGVSLLQLLEGNAPDRTSRSIYSETFYPRLHFGWSDLASLIGARYQYIDGPGPELYDLTVDPGEHRNVLTAERRVLASLRTELGTYDRSLKPPSAVDDETRRAMEALGYVGAGASPERTALRADPKTQLSTLADLKHGFAAMAQQDYRQAVLDLRKVIASNPDMADAWEFLARALAKIGDEEGAIGAYQQALRLSGGSPIVAVSLASLYFDLGRDDQATEHARAALAGQPSLAHGLLAQIALRHGQLDHAEQEARAAAQDGNLRLSPLVTLAEVLHTKGRYDEAWSVTQEAETIYAGRTTKDLSLVQGLALLEGKILADQGKATEAEAAFEREIDRFPNDERAYPNLAILQALTGRPDAATATLQKMLVTHPSPAAFAQAVKTYRVLRDPAGADALLRAALLRYPQSGELRALAAASASALSKR